MRQYDCKRHTSDFRFYECEGCRKQFERMDALNRHLKSETGVECARVVERGMGSGSGGGGVLGDLDSGLATDWWRWCRYFVWGDIMVNAFNLNFHPLYRFASHCYERVKRLSPFLFFFFFGL